MYEYHVVVRAIMEERMREAEHYRQNAGRRPPKPSPTARLPSVQSPELSIEMNQLCAMGCRSTSVTVKETQHVFPVSRPGTIVGGTIVGGTIGGTIVGCGCPRYRRELARTVTTAEFRGLTEKRTLANFGGRSNGG